MYVWRASAVVQSARRLNCHQLPRTCRLYTERSSWLSSESLEKGSAVGGASDNRPLTVAVQKKKASRCRCTEKKCLSLSLCRKKPEEALWTEWRAKTKEDWLQLVPGFTRFCVLWLILFLLSPCFVVVVVLGLILCIFWLKIVCFWLIWYIFGRADIVFLDDTVCVFGWYCVFRADKKYIKKANSWQILCFWLIL